MVLGWQYTVHYKQASAAVKCGGQGHLRRKQVLSRHFTHPKQAALVAHSRENHLKTVYLHMRQCTNRHIADFCHPLPSVAFRSGLRLASAELLRLLVLRTQTKLRDRSMVPEVCQADSMMTFKEKIKAHPSGISYQ